MKVKSIKNKIMKKLSVISKACFAVAFVALFVSMVTISCVGSGDKAAAAHADSLRVADSLKQADSIATAEAAKTADTVKVEATAKK